MSEKKVFWSSIEYKYEKKSADYPDLKGGFVYAFVYALDVLETLGKINAAFEDNSISILEVEFVKPYEEDTYWDTEENKSHYTSLYKEAEGSEVVIFDTFYDYEQK